MFCALQHELSTARGNWQHALVRNAGQIWRGYSITIPAHNMQNATTTTTTTATAVTSTTTTAEMTLMTLRLTPLCHYTTIKKVTFGVAFAAAPLPISSRMLPQLPYFQLMGLSGLLHMGCPLPAPRDLMDSQTCILS